MRPSVLTLLVVCPLLGGCESLSKLGDELFASVDKPRASISGVRFQDLSLEDVTMLFDVDVENPYSTDLPLLDLRYGVSSGGKEILSGLANVAGSIPASGSRTLQVPAKVTFQSLLGLLSNVRPGQLVPYEADLGLKLDAPVTGPLELPLRTSGELPIPAVPNLKVGGIRVDELSLNAAKIVLDLDVGNTNEFALDLLDFDYGFSIAGAEVARSALDRSASFEPGGTTSLEIPLSFSPSKLGLAVFNVLSGQAADYSLTGNMTADTPFGALDLPISSQGKAPLRRS